MEKHVCSEQFHEVVCKNYVVQIQEYFDRETYHICAEQQFREVGGAAAPTSFDLWSKECNALI